MRTIPKTDARTTGTNNVAPQPNSTHPERVEPVWRSRAILDDAVTARVLHAVWSGDVAVIAKAPPGAGKTRLVALLAASLADRAGLRVAVAAQTRAQALEIATRLAGVTGDVSLAWSAGPVPDLPEGVRLVGGKGRRAMGFPSTGGGVVVATTAKWLLSNATTMRADVVIVDEAWQGTYADIGALGAFAAQACFIGDPGQIDPVVTGETTRWADDPHGPHVSAPDAVLAAYPDAVTEVRLPHTYRLGPVTTALLQPAFYADLPFTSKRPDEFVSDAQGLRLPEVAVQPVTLTYGPTDPALAHALADRVRTLLAGTVTTAEGARPLSGQDMAVVVPHVGQAAAVRALLADVDGLLVGTANGVQGMERAAVVAAHPLAGYRDPTVFGTDPGRACVMLSRHRAHLSVVADTNTPDVLARAVPDAGTQAHQRLWERLHAVNG